jgi:CheY-like chemotaxis protein
VADLPLLEILQVVSACGKTGHLTVRSPEGETAVVFRDGRVVSGYIWDIEALGRGSVGPGPADEGLIRRRIASILARLIRLREGEFAFTLTERIPERLGGRDLAAETLSEGINPEELMLDLARQMDEDRRDCTAAIEASFSTPDIGEDVLEDLQLEEIENERPPGSSVLFVDDEPEVRQLVGERLQAAGFEVIEAASTEEARREAARLATDRPFILVADLGLPSEGGTTFRGGLDVVRYAAALPSPPPTLLTAEAIDETLRARARRLGVTMLAFKPGLSKLDPLQYQADLRAFGDKLARDLLPRLLGRHPPTRVSKPPLKMAATTAGPPPAEEVSRVVALHAALDDLGRHPDPDLVSFLLLRAARAFFPRALLFVVKDERLRGLAGFGLTANGESLDLLARDLTVPLDEPSPFAGVVVTGRTWSGPSPSDGPARRLLDRIGPLDASAMVLVPVCAQRETVAVVFGDDPGGSRLPPLDSFVAFVERAGRALDEAFLARRAGAPAA